MIPSPPPAARQVGLSEMLAALSHALDLTEGQPPGHTLRACRIGMRLADEAGLSPERRESLYYALLLKDAGAGLDRIAAAFAEIIDAKSPFTFRHSANVAEVGDLQPHPRRRRHLRGPHRRPPLPRRHAV